MRLRFFNTFDTAAPFFRTLLPFLAARGHEAEAVFARQKYRPGGLGAVDGAYRIREVPTIAPGGVESRTGKASIALSYALSAATLSLSSGWPDLNVFLTQPPLFASWGRVLRSVRRRPYCLIGMDLYPWVAIEAGVMSRTGFKTATARSLAVASLKGAARVIVIGRCMAERVAALGVPEDRIRLISNWADPTVIRPVPPEANDLRDRFELRDKFVVMYSGNLGVSHYFDDLMAVAHRLQELPDVVFLFVGSGSRLTEVQLRSEELGLSNVRFLGYQKYEQLSESLSMGDVHFVSLRNGFEGLVVPSKTYGVLAAGRPVIYQGSPHGEIARMLEETETGAVMEPGSAEALEAAILRAYHDADWRLEAGRRARRVAVEKYSPEIGLTSYAETFEALATHGGGASP